MEPETLPSLRPLRFGELFDQAFRIYRRNFLTFIGILAIVYIPYILLISVSSTFFLTDIQKTKPSEIITSPSYWLFILTMLVAAGLSVIFINGLGAAALTHATARSYMNQNISIIGSYRGLGTSWLHLLFSMFVFSLMISIVSTWTIVPIVGWFTGIGAMLFLSGVVETLLPSMAVIEKQTWVAPIGRAWNLARRRFWWLMGVASILGLFTLLISIGPTLLIEALTSALVGNNQDMLVIRTLISSILNGLLQIITLPIFIIIRTLIYFDLRIRTEGLDLALASLEVPEGTQIDLASITVPQTKQPWLTWDDITKFAIISIGILGIIALFVGVGALIIVAFDAVR